MPKTNPKNKKKPNHSSKKSKTQPVGKLTKLVGSTRRPKLTWQKVLPITAILIIGLVGAWFLVASRAEPPTRPFRVATFNVHTAGGFSGADRMKKSVNYITGHGYDIVGLQELEMEPQFREARQQFQAAGYNFYPAKPERIYRSGITARSIIYKDRFEIVSTDDIEYPRMEWDGREQPAHAPVVLFRDKQTNEKFYFINTHNAAYPQGARERYRSGLKYAEKINKLNQNYPVIFVGDFNESSVVSDGPNTTLDQDRSNLNYCVLGKNDLLRFAKDKANGADGVCPSRGDDGIDRIYVSCGVYVYAYHRFDAGEAAGTDHRSSAASDVSIRSELKCGR